MELKVLGIGDIERIRKERNALPDGILRTPFPLTCGMQDDWYYREIDNRDSRTRYWGLYAESEQKYDADGNKIPCHTAFVGYGGIENIDWQNGTGELSLLIFKNHKKQGYGSQAVRLFLERAFNFMRLGAVIAEVYDCNPNFPFWEKMAMDYGATLANLPCRKFIHGRFYGSAWYTFTREKYEENTE